MVSRPAPPTKAPCQDSLSLRLRASRPLTSPARTTRRFIMQKARRHPINGAPTACGQTGSGSVSLPCPGCFSPFPHGTRPLSVFGEYLALPDGPGRFTLDYSCPALLRMPPPPRPLARKGLSPATARLSRAVPVRSRGGPRGPTTPGTRRHDPGLGSSAFARHYLRNHVCFLFLRVLRCFSSPRSPPGLAGMAPLHGAGLPHSEIPGSRDICSSPGLIAACHVLRRLPKPRHPPSALLSLFLQFLQLHQQHAAPYGTARAVARMYAARDTRRFLRLRLSSLSKISAPRRRLRLPRGPRRAAGIQARGPFSFPPPTGLPAPTWRIRGSNPWPPACKAGALSRLS